MKPRELLFFFFGVFFSLGAISLVFPSEGIRVSEDIKIDFPSIDRLFYPDTTNQKDFSEILEASFDIDSLESAKELKNNSIKDSIRRAREEDSIRQWQLKLHFPEENPEALRSVFTAIEKAKKSGKKVRIMHYGDSQIEGDRITGYLRYKLQSRFGGSGPGLVAAVPLVRPVSVQVEQSENWKRYTMFGVIDSTITHNKFGILANYGRFTPPVLQKDSINTNSDSTLTDTFITNEDIKATEAEKVESQSGDSTAVNIVSKDTTKAWIKFSKSNLTYRTTPDFNEVKILFGNLTTPLSITATINDSITVKQENYLPGKKLEVFQFELDEKTTDLYLEFSSIESPDIYCISLDNKRGVAVDNIAMRGSSGTLFKKIDRELFIQSMKVYHPEMLILQFGGNVMPYMTSVQKCKQYGRWFDSQLKYFKRINPNISIIVIGPSDMGYFEEGKYKSYELLPKVRDELKRVTLANSGVYWDLMEAMGGSGSMEAWVEANPPLAGKDYIHFNRRGASKIAQMFYNSFIEEYQKYEELTN